MMKFMGAGQFYYAGVPARDLTDEEWAALPADLRAAAAGLYVEKHTRAEARAEAKAEADAAAVEMEESFEAAVEVAEAEAGAVAVREEKNP